MLSLVLLAVTLVVQPAPAGPGGGSTARAEAYQAFLEARRLESTGDAAGAIAALERAATLDESPGILTELGQLYARHDRADDARRVAGQALTRDADNADAHWLLGMLGVPASAMQGDRVAPRDRAAVDTAIGHLEKAAAGRTYDTNIPMVLGRLYLQVGRAADAATVLRSVYDGDGGSLETGALLAQALERTDRRDEALGVLEEVLDAEPGYFRARVQQAELLERARRWREAATAYGLAADENPKAVELRLRQATALLGADDADQARRVLEQAVEAHPTDLQARYLLAQAQRQLGDGEGAERNARVLLAIAPTDVRGPLALSQVHADRGEHRQVVDLLTPLVEQGRIANAQSAAGVTMRLANAHMALGERDAAIGVIEKARAARADSILDAYLLQTLVVTRQFDRAIALGRDLRTARPGDVQIGRLLAQAYIGAKQPDEAVALLEGERTRRPDDPSTALALASTLADAGREPQALKLLDDTEQAFGSQVGYWFQRGAILERLGRRAEAKIAFRKGLAVQPDHAPSLNYLGYMLVEDGVSFDEAVTMIRKALEADPDNGSYLDSLGWAYFKQGRIKDARQPLQRAAAIETTNSVIQDHLGDVLLALGDKRGAVAAWERALAGDNESTDATAIRSKIERARGR
ncbi:MAG: tetratricopeptide repeat protein [Acidobacteria bacterium]|nr:tetratricopeptide repeat protein [Acidobacteriota bacterium]